MRPPVGPQKPPSTGGTVTPTHATADRWSEATRYVERFFRSRTAPQRRGMDTWESGARVAKTTTGVSARSGATYGTGTIIFQVDDGTSLSDDGIDTYDVKNVTDNVIASAAYVLVIWAQGAWWVAVPGSCSNLS